MPDLQYHLEEDGYLYTIQVNNRCFQYGAGETSVRTMSAAGGGGGSATLQEFLDGAYNDFVWSHFGKEVLEEIKANIRQRLKTE